MFEDNGLRISALEALEACILRPPGGVLSVFKPFMLQCVYGRDLLIGANHWLEQLRMELGAGERSGLAWRFTAMCWGSEAGDEETHASDLEWAKSYSTACLEYDLEQEMALLKQIGEDQGTLMRRVMFVLLLCASCIREHRRNSA